MSVVLDSVRIATRLAPARRIQRHRAPSDETSFEALRAEGIRLIQSLSGRIWTDYNLHDPGVTILEQLCFALTELCYRVEFPVADHLAGADGKIDFHALALIGPAKVFPCRPTCIADYRRALLDRIDTIENVWLSASRGNRKGAGKSFYHGLYRIVVKRAEEILAPQISTTSGKDPVEDEVLAVYRRNRGLCEDVGEVTVAAPADYELLADIDIEGTRSPVEIAAEIYVQCARAMAVGLSFESFEQALERGDAVEDILNPRYSERGVLGDEALITADRGQLFVGDLVTRVKVIDGIRRVRHLALRAANGAACTGTLTWDPQLSAPRLHPPSEAGQLNNIALFRGGSRLELSAREVRARYQDLRASTSRRTHGPQNLETLLPQPRGTFRDLQSYTSIQNQFPAVYGINAEGLPASSTAERRAQARQLKGYLALFDQIMADAAAQLHHLRDLLSIRKGQTQTYWTQPLDDAMVPGIGDVYRERHKSDESSDRQQARLNRFRNRRHRVLDYLLALHGETLTQSSLRQWNRCLDPEELEAMLLDNKLAYLRAIGHVSRERSGAFDYGRPSWNVPGNSSGFQTRVSLQLGFQYPYSRGLTAGFDTSAVLAPPHGAAAGGPDLTFDADPNRDPQFQRIVRDPALGPSRSGELDGIFAGRDGRVSEVLLRYGSNLGNYRYQRLRGSDDHLLMFRPPGGARWWVLAKLSSAQLACDAANRLRRYLLDLNVKSEGMHVVEHILLRPLSHEATAQAAGCVPASFYSLRMTVLFPAWTARCREEGFRLFAEDTVSRNCPAHVHAECRWLEFREMRDFEALYQDWLCKKIAACQAESGLLELDAAARALEKFLLRDDSASEAVTREMQGPPDE
ncbi:MAG: hypothetical protein ACKVQA_19375 [Burkholderiales bacterium]